MRLLIALFFALGLASCSSNGVGVEGLNQEAAKPQEVLNFGKLPLKNHLGQLTAVIEIPAGTNIKYEYNYDSQSFDVDVVNGQKRIINYIPYPGNYGFIENTFMDSSLGGDGDALDVLVICESLNQSKKIKIDPIGIIKLLDDGEEDHKIIAIPNNDQESFMSDSIPESSGFSSNLNLTKNEFLDINL